MDRWVGFWVGGWKTVKNRRKERREGESKAYIFGRMNRSVDDGQMGRCYITPILFLKATVYTFS